MTPAPHLGPQVLGLPRTERLAGTGNRVQGSLAGHRGGTRPAHRVCHRPAETVTQGTQGHALLGQRGLQGGQPGAGHPSWTGQASPTTGSAFLQSWAPGHSQPQLMFPFKCPRTVGPSWHTRGLPCPTCSRWACCTPVDARRGPQGEILWSKLVSPAIMKTCGDHGTVLSAIGWSGGRAHRLG